MDPHSDTVNQTLNRAGRAMRTLRDRPARARVLEALASRLEAVRPELIALASEETALTAAELEPEFARAVGTLRMFAGLARSSPVLAELHSPPEALPIGPNHDLRRVLVPIGPVAVFGASNFPLAYGVLGGDTASALAAGCAVVVKEHPAHPRLGRRLAALAREACAPIAPDAVQYLDSLQAHPDPRDHTLARALLAHPALAGVGFTGSVAGGVALAELARARPMPIPVYAEQGSLNPVVLLPGALEEATLDAAGALASSILLRHGQQCTKPGLIVLVELDALGGRGEAFERALTAKLNAGPARRPLAPWIASAYLARLRDCAPHAEPLVGATQPTDGTTRPALLRARGAVHSTLLHETFGPSTVLVHARADELPALLDLLPGSLTGTVWASARERGGELFALVMERRMARAGRVIVNGVPTGVRVAPAMTHTGPWPASNHPEASAVGSAAVMRWLRPVTVQGTLP
ncbi:MAG: aldehyde dehydrogenase family protein [Planctomycetota bacterium]|nr:aldehyde dehydrogenase family protein [Planctomycetota bacterium]